MSGQAVRAGVLGWPVAHSRSPLIFTHWFGEHNIEGRYEALAVAPQDFAAYVRALPARGFRGANVTVPHKQAAFALADETDKMARRLQAANLLCFEAGRIIGKKTDAHGFIANLQENIEAYTAPVDWQNHPACVLGAGGAARAIIIALADRGVPEIRIANRTAEKITALAHLLDGLQTKLTPIAWESRSAALADCGLLVNATSLGQQGQPPLDLSLSNLPPHALICDVVYVPLETELLKNGRACGHICIDGLGMLLHQAVPAFADWTNIMPQVTPALREKLIADLKEGV